MGKPGHLPTPNPKAYYLWSEQDRAVAMAPSQGPAVYAGPLGPAPLEGDLGFTGQHHAPGTKGMNGEPGTVSRQWQGAGPAQEGAKGEPSF